MTSGETLSRAAASEAGWLLYHSVGRFPCQQSLITEALTDAASAWCALDDRRWAKLDAGRAAFLAASERLLNATPGSVFAAENVTQAFAAFIGALPAGTLRGRQVLIAADCFPSLHYLLNGLAERSEFTLVTARPMPGQHWVADEDMIAAWDERVALAIVTWVTSTASHRADLVRLLAHGRRMGSLVAVDATQGLGIVPLDVSTLGIDFAATTALKWLCGVPGAGFGYLRSGLLATATPLLRGWFSKPDPFDWSLDSFSYAADARRFDTGTPSYLPYIGSLPGIRWLLDTGIARLRDANLRLCDELMAVADAHAVPLANPRGADQRGGSVMLELPPAVAASAMVEILAQHGIIADHRGQRLRLSPGPCTGDDIAARLDRALGEGLRQAKSSLAG
jgi:kynureninase